MLTVENVDLFYGASQALRASASARPRARLTCLLGRNGVGKTSLLRAIFGLQPIRSGRIDWTATDLTTLAPHQRARNGLALVPQGREIFLRLTVLENLQTGFSALKRGERVVPARSTRSSGAEIHADAARRRSLGRPAAAARHRPRAGHEAEPPHPRRADRGIQPSIIKDIATVIRQLAARGDIAILLVEQYFDFARELADSFAIMERGEIVLAGGKDDMVERRAAAASDGVAPLPQCGKGRGPRPGRGRGEGSLCKPSPGSLRSPPSPALAGTIGPRLPRQA